MDVIFARIMLLTSVFGTACGIYSAFAASKAALWMAILSIAACYALVLFVTFKDDGHVHQDGADCDLCADDDDDRLCDMGDDVVGVGSGHEANAG